MRIHLVHYPKFENASVHRIQPSGESIVAFFWGVLDSRVNENFTSKGVPARIDHNFTSRHEKFPITDHKIKNIDQKTYQIKHIVKL